MSCQYDINHDTGLVTIQNSAMSALREAWGVARELLTDPDYDASLPHLVDLRGIRVSHTPVERQTFRQFMLEEYRPAVDASVAIVVDESMDRRTLAGLYRIVSNMDRTELFDHYDLALKWLMRREFQASSSPMLSSATLPQKR